jgi:hypothetical protein
MFTLTTPAARAATPTGRGLALVAGVLATAGALAILLQDAIRTGNWTIEHGLIPVLMAVQIITGHLSFTALYQRRWLPAIGLFIVAAVATWCVLDTSIAKQGAVQAEATAKAEDINARRAALERSIADAEAMLQPCAEGTPKRHFGNRCSLREAMTAECATGKGTACTGKTASVTLYEAALKTHRDDFAAIGPQQNTAAKTENMGTLLAAVTGGDKGKIRQILEIVRPFQFALAFELAALVSFGFAFGHRPPSRRDSAQTDFPVETVLDVANDRGPTGNGPGNDGGNGPNGGNRRRVYTRDAATADIIQLVGRGNIPSQETLAQRWGVGKGTVSKWLAGMETNGLIVRETAGRCKRIASA